MRSDSQSMFFVTIKRLLKNKIGVFSLIFIAIIAFIVVFAYPLSTDDTNNANTMHLALTNKTPGFEIDLLQVEKSEKPGGIFSYLKSGKPAKILSVPLESYRINSDTIFYKEYSGLEDVEVANIEEKFILKTPQTSIKKFTFWLGTDRYGRDLLSRMLIGSRISFTIGFIAVLISVVIGIFMGALAGYAGGKVDSFVMWLINIIWSIPTVLMVIAVTFALGKGVWQVFVAVGLTMWVEVARMVRGQVMSVKQMQYVEAAKALGYSNLRIISRHILPNIWGAVIVISAANFASAILMESGLSFLGLGAQPPLPSWGGIIRDHYAYMIMGKPYLALVPGFMIAFLVLAFMSIGNALRDALDVRMN